MVTTVRFRRLSAPCQAARRPAAADLRPPPASVRDLRVDQRGRRPELGPDQLAGAQDAGRRPQRPRLHLVDPARRHAHLHYQLRPVARHHRHHRYVLGTALTPSPPAERSDPRPPLVRGRRSPRQIPPRRAHPRPDGAQSATGESIRAIDANELRMSPQNPTRSRTAVYAADQLKRPVVRPHPRVPPGTKKGRPRTSYPPGSAYASPPTEPATP